jgi:hypothetical protein
MKYNIVNLQSPFQIFRFFLSDDMSILTIFHKTAQLVLPIDFSQFHLVDDLHEEILIAISSWTTIVLS